MLADVLAGVSPAGGNCPVATVVISGGGKGDQPVGSPEVKVSVGWGSPVGSAREASNSTGRSRCEPVKPRNISPTRSGWWDRWGVLSPSVRGEGQGRRRRNWVQAAAELPGVVEGDMSRENAQRKHGTTGGSPRWAHPAKASRISRRAVKSRCAGQWGGWGRVSVAGPGQQNPDRSEGPWGRATAVALTAVLHRSGGSDTERREPRWTRRARTTAANWVTR
jgi:hypothetical protein